jgi:hypothetical protein
VVRVFRFCNRFLIDLGLLWRIRVVKVETIFFLVMFWLAIGTWLDPIRGGEPACRPNRSDPIDFAHIYRAGTPPSCLMKVRSRVIAWL